MRNIRELDLNLLVVLKHLITERSVGGAAKRLDVTSSTISKALAKLRLWFADPLFVRGRKGLQPTNLTLTLEGELVTWLQQTNTIASLTRTAIPDGVHFNLVVQSPFYRSLVETLPMAIHQQYPHSVVKLLGWHGHALSDIINGDTDVGVCVQESYHRGELKEKQLPYYIDHEVLFSDRPVVFLRRDHPLLAREWTLAGFLDCQHSSVVMEHKARWGLDVLLAEKGLQRQVPVMVSSFEQSLQLASQSSTDLIAVAPAYCAAYAARHHANLVTMPLPLPESLYQQLELTFIMLWHKRHNQDARMRWLLDEIKRGCRVGSKVPPVSVVPVCRVASVG